MSLQFRAKMFNLLKQRNLAIHDVGAESLRRDLHGGYRCRHERSV